MIPESDRLAAILGTAMLEAIDRSVAARLPEFLTKTVQPVESFISTAEVARRAGVKSDTVLDWIAKGRLPASRLPGGKAWRVRPADLELVLAGQRPVLPPVDLAERRREAGRRLADGVDRGGGGEGSK